MVGVRPENVDDLGEVRRAFGFGFGELSLGEVEGLGFGEEFRPEDVGNGAPGEEPK